IAQLAQQVDDQRGLESYDLVVGDDRSGTQLAVAYWIMVNLFRARKGLGEAQLGLMDGGYIGPIDNGMFPAASSKGARALVVTDIVNKGHSADTVANAVAASRSVATTDVVALASRRSKLPTRGFALYTPNRRDGVQQV